MFACFTLKLIVCTQDTPFQKLGKEFAFIRDGEGNL